MSETPGGVVDPRPADGSPDIGTVVGVSARQDPDEEEDDEEEDDDTDDNGEDEGDSDGYSE